MQGPGCLGCENLSPQHAQVTQVRGFQSAPSRGPGGIKGRMRVPSWGRSFFREGLGSACFGGSLNEGFDDEKEGEAPAAQTDLSRVEKAKCIILRHLGEPAGKASWSERRGPAMPAEDLGHVTTDCSLWSKPTSRILFILDIIRVQLVRC